MDKMIETFLEEIKKFWEKVKGLWNKWVDWMFKGFYK